MNKTSRWLFALTISGSIIAAAVYFMKRQVSPKPITAHPQSAPTTAPEKSAASQLPVPESPKAAGLTRASIDGEMKFSEMDVLERNSLLAEIVKLPHSEIFRLWLAAGRAELDLMKQSAIGTKLGATMRLKASSPEFFTQIQAFVADPSNSVEERRRVIGILGFASTKESIELLITLASTLPDEDLRHSVISGIRGTGQMLEAQHAERLIPLVRAWNQSSDPQLLQAVGIAMAEIGAPEGVALLLSSTSLPAGIDDVHGSVAKAALEKVYADQAVVPVAEFLRRQPAATPASALAGKILVNIGSAEAGKVLLGWLQNAEAAASSEAYEFVISTRSPALLKVWRDTSDQSMSFRSEVVRRSIQNGLSDYQRGRSLKSP